MRSTTLGARALVTAALGAAILFTIAPPAPTDAASSGSTAARVIAIARAQIGDPWRYGANGPRAFDCSGLVGYAFRQAGQSRVVGSGHYRSARALYRYFQARGLASRSKPRPGDLVIWGGGTHVGIYIGNGKAISTLRRGVRVHGVFAVRARFTAYLHTNLAQTAPVPAPTVVPPPSPAPVDPAPSASSDLAAIESAQATAAPTEPPPPSAEPSPTPTLDPSPSPSPGPATEPEPNPSPSPSAESSPSPPPG